MWAKGTGAMTKQYSGKQRSDETIPIAAAIRGDKSVRIRARAKRIIALSAIDSSGPVSQPSLNSVPCKPLVSLSAR